MLWLVHFYVTHIGIDQLLDIGPIDSARISLTFLLSGRREGRYEAHFFLLPGLQGDPSGWMQPPVDLGLGSSGSCPTAQARWQNKFNGRL